MRRDSSEAGPTRQRERERERERERRRVAIKFTSPKKKIICYDSVTGGHCVRRRRRRRRPRRGKKSNFFDELPPGDN